MVEPTEETKPKKKRRVGSTSDTCVAFPVGDEIAAAKARDRKGIVHVASIPPGMPPGTLRNLMLEFGDVGRVYLAPEDEHTHRRRKFGGGTTRKFYTEGWVEFEDKRVARDVASQLHCTNIGGRGSSYYHDFLWNLKYLPKFKWHQLNEGAIYQRQVRKARLSQKMAQAHRENLFFLEQVEKANAKKKIARRKAEQCAKRGEHVDEPNTAKTTEPDIQEEQIPDKRRKAEQCAKKGEPVDEPNTTEPDFQEEQIPDKRTFVTRTHQISDRLLAVLF